MFLEKVFLSFKQQSHSKIDIERVQELKSEIDSKVAKITELLHNDVWYISLIKDVGQPMANEQMARLVSESYQYLAPLLCEFVSMVQQETSGLVKICPFRSGEIYSQIANTIYSGRERNQWQCFDYPRNLRHNPEKISNNHEFGWWINDVDVKNFVLRPKEVVVVDLGFDGSVQQVFDIARKYKAPVGFEKKTKAYFVFTTFRGIQKLAGNLRYSLLLPDNYDLSEDELLNDPEANGLINLAQIVHDSTRGCYGPKQLSPSISDTVVVKDQVNRPLHPNPWIYARNYLVTHSVLEYAKTHRKQLGVTQIIQQITSDRAIDWAANIDPEGLKLFTLSNWEDEVVSIPDSSIV